MKASQIDATNGVWEPRGRLLAVTAHPDDESLGFGGSLARYSAEGYATYVLSATRGEKGRHGEGDRPEPETLARKREAELRMAAAALGVAGVEFLDCPDGGVAEADPGLILARIVRCLRRLRPHVVLTFGPDGAYGHPDHVAVSQLTTSAVVCAADPGYVDDDARERDPHRVSKLYYLAWPAKTWDIYQDTFKTLACRVDGEERTATPWPDWAITTRIGAEPWWPWVWRAVRCHKTQMAVYGALADLSEDRHEALWGNQTFYRAMSVVNGGRGVESDLFEGVGTSVPGEVGP